MSGSFLPEISKEFARSLRVTDYVSFPDPTAFLKCDKNSDRRTP